MPLKVFRSAKYISRSCFFRFFFFFFFFFGGGGGGGGGGGHFCISACKQFPASEMNIHKLKMAHSPSFHKMATNN